MEVYIPTRHRDCVVKLVRLEETTWPPFLSVLQGIKPTLRLGSNEIVCSVVEATNLDAVSAEEVMEALPPLYLYYLNQRTSPEEFSADLCRAVRGFSAAEHVTDAEFSVFQNWFPKLLQCEESIGISAKALSLLYDEQKVVSGSKILSDIRPVFLSDPEGAPPAALIIHSLKLQFMEDGAEKELFVTMDSSDLMDLQRVVDRAIKKEETLKTLLSDTRTSWLGVQS